MKNNSKKKGNNNMLVPTIVLGVIAVILLIVGYSRGGSDHIDGIVLGLKMLVPLIPLLIFAFIIAGMIQILIPTEVVSKWVGVESGFRGILIGTVSGALVPGGPFVSLPLAVGFLRSGASVGTMVAFLTSWSLWAISRLPMEFAILGWRMTVLRFVSVFIFPPIAGYIAEILFRLFKFKALF